MADGVAPIDDCAEANAASAKALDAARAQLASVSQELVFIRQQLDVNAMMATRDATLPDPDVDILASDNPAAEIQALRAALRHLKVDREEANERADRLAREKEELLAAHARMETELRHTRRNLGETRRRLRHREIDLQQYTGKAPMEPLDMSESVDTLDEGDSLSSPMLRSLVPASSKKEGVAVQRLQAELQEKEARQQKMDRRMRKERERVEGLVVLAERQHDEISCLRRQRAASNAYAGQCEQRLKESIAQKDVWQSAVRNSAPAGEMQSGNSAAGSSGAGGGRGMQRHQSAPNRLPPCNVGSKHG